MIDTGSMLTHIVYRLKLKENQVGDLGQPRAKTICPTTFNSVQVYIE